MDNPHTHLCIISLASNHDAEKNLPEARQCLEQILISPHFTEALWTEPIGSQRPDLYLNQLVQAHTMLTAEQLNDVYDGKIFCSAQGENSLTFVCYGTEPTENIPITVLIVG